MNLVELGTYNAVYAFGCSFLIRPAGWPVGWDWLRQLRSSVKKAAGINLSSSQQTIPVTSIASDLTRKRFISAMFMKNEPGYWNLPKKSAKYSWPTVLKLWRTEKYTERGYGFSTA